MMKPIFSMTFTLLIACLPLVAQVQGNFKQRSAAPASEQAVGNAYNNVQQYQTNAPVMVREAVIKGENVAEISISVLANRKADSYTAIFNVVQLGKTAEETNNALKSRLDPFIADMKNAGIKMEDIYIDMVNFLPKYEYDVTKRLFSKKTYTEIPIGFELQKNIHVRFADPAVLDRIVEAAARYEIYDIVKVDYFVKDPKNVYSLMRGAALDYFKEIREAYKGVLSLDSAYVITGENAQVFYPADRYQSYMAFSAQTLEPGERADAKIDRADKPVSMFYNAIPANEYDIVINPDILEPCAQFTYHLTVRCTMMERRPKVQLQREKEFILVTPTGETKTLKIE